ncbi:MAG: indolepyruvate ferredoxin oxidoreductase subunit alpha [Clostridiales bacterium]
MKQLLTGNEAVAHGAWEAGVHVVAAYPGTPSTEITENAAKYKEIYAEWAPNEKVAMEVGIGAAIGGGRALVAMKHVGVNVAMDPLMTVAFSGINRGLVFVSADDPGMHSSQNEQDNRNLGIFAKIPIFEPSDSAECLEFTKMAFELSEEFDTPVMLRLTTRVAHSQSLVEKGERQEVAPNNFEENPQKFVMIPAHARPRHHIAEERLVKLSKYVETSPLNREEMNDKKIGVIVSGIVYEYVKEALPQASILKLGISNPLPKEMIKDFAKKVETLYVIEELDSIIEDQCRAMGLNVHGKDIFSREGEIFPEIIAEKILGIKTTPAYKYDKELPMRPPVLCAGCPHRGTFHVLKKAKCRVIGDIGCYTLGCSPPLQAVDTTICMGAGIGMAMGMEKVHGEEFAEHTVSVIGDSTFMHSGITGLVDMVYNKGVGTVIILDNSITAMTGHQQNPLTGFTVKNEPTKKIDLELLVKGLGIDRVSVVDPFDVKGFKEILKVELKAKEPSVIIARRPCALLIKTVTDPMYIEADRCLKCGSCLKIGCPAIEKTGDVPIIHGDQCVGCGLCLNICPHGVIRKDGGE